MSVYEASDVLSRRNLGWVKIYVELGWGLDWIWLVEQIDVYLGVVVAICLCLPCLLSLGFVKI